jgi:D-hexose-6-phosphate mutarotase
MPTLEMVRFSVAPDLEEAVVAEHREVLAALTDAAPGLERAYLSRAEDGLWLHLLVWQDRAAALAAAQRAPGIPVCAAWFGKLGDVRMEHLDVLDVG